MPNATATSQLPLFALEPAAAPAAWTAHRGPWGKNLTWTRDDMPGLTVKHCGHATALYPYYAYTRDAGLGVTFRTLAECKTAAAAWYRRHDGFLETSATR